MKLYEAATPNEFWPRSKALDPQWWSRLEHAEVSIRREIARHLRWLERIGAADRDLDDTIQKSPASNGVG